MPLEVVPICAYSARESFADPILQRFASLRDISHQDGILRKSILESVSRATQMGHPDFAHLPLGGSGTCMGVTAFIDMAAFTARTFWDDPQDVLWLNMAVLTQVAKTVQGFGGHVLGLRGDGVFACFGDKRMADMKVAAGACVAACAFILDGAKGPLNEALEARGMEPVRLRAGADFGDLSFVRIGTETASEVNVVGFAANFASKCEKHAGAWGLVVGEELASLLPESDISLHEQSPKRYVRKGEERRYRFYDVSLPVYLKLGELVQEQLNGRPLSAIVPH
ncbi:adenylate/guanylate cyclase domain-containing protein [Streptomyces hokutonensis]|uniref:adenylate/guanylate cyclase domain-containing protein n=1 Tax=Streptomyces hokutonensis TaxID=1306990 RepID=UPI0036767FEF